MEHEDNTQYENYLQNSQNILENLHANIGEASDLGNAVVEEIVNAGNKYADVEHEDEEWKYIKEVQQNEKQQQIQQQKEHLNDEEPLFVGDVSKVGEVEGADMLLESKKGVEFFVGTNGADISAYDANQEKKKHDVFENEYVARTKNDCDFATDSNLISATETALTDEVLGRKIEAKNQSTDALKFEQKTIDYEPNQDEQKFLMQDDEEELSSVATTFGTSSISENAMPFEHEQLQNEYQQEYEQKKQFDFHCEPFADKENTDPINSPHAFNIENLPPNNLDLDISSQLNPNAVEFIPSFGSSQLAGDPPNAPALRIEDSAAQDNAVQPNQNLFVRHIVGVDDLVAESPRKERCSNMDAILLPGENEFEHEISKRPHELEFDLDDGFIADNNGYKNDVENGNSDSLNCSDYRQNEHTSLIDHGPETSVDLDISLMEVTPGGLTKNDDSSDVMNQSIYVERNNASAPIQDILNKVQVLPDNSDDSLNNSFVENDTQLEEQNIERNFITAEKELLHVEEKEHISHSPSTEELPNVLHTSAKDISQLSIDLNIAANTMQDSFYLESTSSDVLQQQQKNCSKISEDYLNYSLLTDIASNENVFDTDVPQCVEQQLKPVNDIVDNTNLSPLPLPEEKLLLEDTKEEQIEFTIVPPVFDKKTESISLSSNVEQAGSLPQEKEDEQFDASKISMDVTEIVNDDAYDVLSKGNNDDHQNKYKMNDSLSQEIEQQPVKETEKTLVQIGDQSFKEIVGNNTNYGESMDVIEQIKTAETEDVFVVSEPEVISIKKTVESSTEKLPTGGVASSKSRAGNVALKKSAVSSGASDPNSKKSGTKSGITSGRPRTAPTAGVIPVTKAAPVAKTSSSTTKTAHTGVITRKPLASNTSVVVKSAAPRPNTAPPKQAMSAISKSSTVSRFKSAACKPTANGNTASTKSREAGAIHAKPTMVATNSSSTIKNATAGTSKTNLTSPRATLTSQLRKPLQVSTTGACKSPTKPSTNGCGKSVNTSVRSATQAALSCNTNAAKPFTARPAPKSTHNSNITAATTNARRVTTIGNNSSSINTSTAAVRKITPTKPSGAATAKKSPLALKGKEGNVANVKPPYLLKGKKPTEISKKPCTYSNSETNNIAFTISDSTFKDIIKEHGENSAEFENSIEYKRSDEEGMTANPLQSDVVALLDI